MHAALTAPPHDPAQLTAWLHAAVAAHQSGRLADAERGYRQVLAANPWDPDALRLLGVLAGQAGQHAVAVDLLRRAVLSTPGDPLIHHALGNAQNRLGRADAAIGSYRRAIRVKPDEIDWLMTIGKVAHEQSRMIRARSSFHAALVLNPAHAHAWSNLAVSVRALGNGAAALAAYRRALALNPGTSEFHSNYSGLLLDLNRIAEAGERGRRAVALAPDVTYAQNNLANALKESGAIAAAETAYRRTLRLDPGMDATRKNLGMCLLQRGDLRQGFHYYEARRVSPDIPRRDFGRPEWDGRPLSGQTVLLHHEQGFGDTIMFARFARQAVERGARVVLEVQPPLVRLLTTLPGVTTVVGEGDPLPPFDLCAPLLSLPDRLGTTLETLPCAVPYLMAEPERVAAWAARLPSRDRGLRIGIVWQGKPTSPADRGRSFQLSEYLPVARLPGVQLISLQKEHGLDQIAALPAGITVHTLGSDFDAGPNAFLDTAAVMMNLDLVITSDTGIAHLAGALGRPTWVLLQAFPEWRWLLDRDDSPWYPSARLFRQDRPGDWASAFAKVVAALTERLSGAS